MTLEKLNEKLDVVERRADMLTHDVEAQCRILQTRVRETRAEVAKLTWDQPEPDGQVEWVTEPIPAQPVVPTVSKAGLQFIAMFEGCELKPYKDAAGYWTIGVGHLLNDDEIAAYVDEGVELEPREALDLLYFDAHDAWMSLAHTLPHMAWWREVPFNHQQCVDALTCFVFNIGTGAWRRSTLNRKLMQSASWDAACEAVRTELPRWNRAGGRVLEGLVRRRAETVELFCEGDYYSNWFKTPRLLLSDDIPGAVRRESPTEQWLQEHRAMRNVAQQGLLQKEQAAQEEAQKLAEAARQENRHPVIDERGRQRLDPATKQPLWHNADGTEST